MSFAYRLKSTGESSAYFGPCEVCRKHVSEVFMQTEECYVDEENPINGQEGFMTLAGCRCTAFGHKDCLTALQRTTASPATTLCPTTDQIQALKDFAKIHGHHWKSVLRDAWMDGDYQGFEHSHLLQQIRNTLGPGWLMRFVLPKDGCWVVFNRAEDAVAAEAAIREPSGQCSKSVSQNFV